MLGYWWSYSFCCLLLYDYQLCLPKVFWILVSNRLCFIQCWFAATYPIVCSLFRSILFGKLFLLVRIRGYYIILLHKMLSGKWRRIFSCKMGFKLTLLRPKLSHQLTDNEYLIRLTISQSVIDLDNKSSAHVGFEWDHHLIVTYLRLPIIAMSANRSL